MPDYLLTPSDSPYHSFPLLAASDNLIFVTGIGGGDDITAAEATREALEKIQGLLEEAGSSLSEIVYFRPLVSKREYIDEVAEVLDQVIPDPKPASGALIICELARPELKVEFEAIAQRDARGIHPKS